MSSAQQKLRQPKKPSGGYTSQEQKALREQEIVTRLGNMTASHLTRQASAYQDWTLSGVNDAPVWRC